MSQDRFFVENAGPDCLDELLALEELAFEDGWTSEDLGAELDRGDGIFLLVRDGSSGLLAGYACWRHIAEEAELLRIAVAPDHRRRGLARQLLEEGLRRLAGAGARECFLEVRPDNLAAASLYRSLGFRRTGQRPLYYRDGSPADLYSRDLAAGSLA